LIEAEPRDAYDFIREVGHEVNRAYAAVFDELAPSLSEEMAKQGLWNGSRLSVSSVHPIAAFAGAASEVSASRAFGRPWVAAVMSLTRASQKQRMKALFEPAEKVLPEAESWRRRQLQPLIDTRNFLTHWGEPTKDVLEDWDLWFALNRMRVVLEGQPLPRSRDRPSNDLSRSECGLSRTGVHGSRMKRMVGR
jgi:hypothetical protein